MPKVSIIVPVYNVEKYLRRCLTSLVNQDYDNIEIIIVNDGSPDNSAKIIKEFKKKYPAKIKYFYKKNGGLSSARNFGLNKITGDYVLFVDSDDYVETTMISKMMTSAIHNNSDIVICNIFDEYENKNIVKTYKNSYLKNNSSVYANKEILLNRFAAWNKLYKVSLFNDKKIIFDEGKIYEDLRLIMKIYLNANIITYVEEPLYHYVIRDGSIMTSSGLEKNIEIIYAFEDVISYYKNQGQFDNFKTELEFLAIDHILVAAIVRVLKLSNWKNMKKNVLTYINYINKTFPNYKKNPYILCYNKRKKIVLYLIEHQKFIFLKFLIKVKDLK